jgi:trans-aconitate 2-methyltransferase
VREWNAGVYHKVSNPQLEWGLAVLERLPLEGSEVVLDVGCGTGRLTEKVLERLPRGRVAGIDQSANMLRAAHQHLGPRFGSRIHLAQADAAALPFYHAVDAIFSTATFHWVLDHDRLFASLYAALKPGGRLVAQCGGGRNIERIHGRCLALMRKPGFAPYFTRWSEPWYYADAAATAARLARAGFSGIRTGVVRAPVVFEDADSFR